MITIRILMIGGTKDSVKYDSNNQYKFEIYRID
jgi:hypothetical protein